MLLDLKLLAVSLCVLLLCDHAFTRCKMSKRCERKGGKCSRRNEVPAGFELLGTCQGKCKCYKKVESFPLYPSPMMNMANMTDISQKDGNRTKHQMSKRCERKGGRCSCRNEVPSPPPGFELLGTCQGKCKCYKKVESFPLYPSPMMNMTNVTDSQKDENRTKQQRTGFSCKENEWEGNQYCKCRPGQKISVFKSEFSWWYEDRKWDLECADIQPKEISKHTSWTTEVSSSGMLEMAFIWHTYYRVCVMVGMTSEFDSWSEDRRYKVIYSCSPNWVYSSCTNWIRLNYWEEHVNHVLGSTQVIKMLYSTFSTWYEDRAFWISVCDLVPKCDQLVSITYDHDKMTTTEGEETVANGYYDNSGGTSQNYFTATISYSQQTRLADTYTFSHTSGWSATVSGSVTLGYNWGVAVAGGHVSVTAGFSSTWDTSDTWTRTQTKTYVETHTEGFTFTAKCNPGCKCKLVVKVTHGEGHIPYTMITKSKGTNVETCEEKGVLHVGRAWNANAKSVDECG